MVPDIWDYLLSLDPTSPVVQQYNTECTAAALAAGTAAVREAHDPQYGGFYESFDPRASANTEGANPMGISRVKVWWIQNEALLALYKLHKLQVIALQPQAGNAVGQAGAAGAGAGTQPNYLQLLAETARFLRQHQTDNEVAGEQFWQVSLYWPSL
jgi:mannose/cellobiose epimerase-like protein (N-acyl-D-glucosamine 2-epimerase family)